MSTTVCVRAHAKINLGLEVLRQRPDGYHDLRTVFQTLALHDTLTFTMRPGPFELRSHDANVPGNRANLVWRAALLLWQHVGREGDVENISVDIVKRIPVKGGLGGGSSDAAATLVALTALWGASLQPDEFQALGRRLGADVGFFFTGGTALGLGRGDDISPMADTPAQRVLLVVPGFDVSTPEAFRWIDEERERAGAAPARQARRPDLPIAGGGNDFERVVAARHPEVDQIKRALLDAGASTAALSGSGSTVFGLFDTDATMRAAVPDLSRFGFRLECTHTLSRADYARSARVRSG